MVKMRFSIFEKSVSHVPFSIFDDQIASYMRIKHYARGGTQATAIVSPACPVSHVEKALENCQKMQYNYNKYD